MAVFALPTKYGEAFSVCADCGFYAAGNDGRVRSMEASAMFALRKWVGTATSLSLVVAAFVSANGRTWRAMIVASGYGAAGL